MANKKCIFIICFLIAVLFNVLPALSQSQGKDQHFTDSLEKLIEDSPTDTAKAALLNDLSDYWSEKDTTKALSYAHRALKHSKGYPFYSASSHFALGGAYFYTNAIKGKKEYQKTIQILKGGSSRQALILLSRAWQNYGALIQRSGDNETYLNILLEHAIPLVQKADDTLREASYYGDIGLVFENILNYDKAIHYYQMAISLLLKTGEKSMRLADFYTRAAKNYLYKSNDTNNYYTSTKVCLDSAGKILSAFPASFEQANYRMVLGMYYFHKHFWNKAFQSLDSSVMLAEKLHLPYFKASVLFQKYEAYKAAKNYPQAKKILLGLYRDSITALQPRNQLLFLNHLARVSSQMGQMKEAYDWLSQYVHLDDSLKKKKTDASIEALEVKYQSEKKEREILSLKNKNQEQQLIIQKKRFLNSLLIAGGLLFLLIAIMIYLLYRNKRRRHIQENKLHQQHLEQLKQENQLKIYDAMIEGQEQERQRVARDLHDDLGGMLSGIKLKLSSIAENEKNKKDMELYKVINQLDQSVSALRHIARNMMPETLLRFGLEVALKDLCESLQNDQIQIDFQVYQLNEKLPQPVQINIYRIVQELTTNAIRHGHASHILIQVSQNKNRIFITAEDDGAGFDKEILKSKKGLGISNINNRVDFLKGNIDIESAPGEGTTVNVEVNTHE